MIMKGTLIILAVLCAWSFVAAAPERRFPREAAKNICDPQTPCSWAVYKYVTKFVYMHVQNDYCVCGEDKICTHDEDDAGASAYVYRCKVASATTHN